MSEMLACCAHSRVSRQTNHHPDGTCSDIWWCNDCQTQFVPWNCWLAQLAEAQAKIRWFEGTTPAPCGYPWDAPYQDGVTAGRDEAQAELARINGAVDAQYASTHRALRERDHARRERDALRAALQEIFNVGPLGVDTYAVCWKRIHAIADEALHGPAAANAAPHGNAGDVSVPSDAQGSAYKAAVPFGEMGQIATPHDGGQAASGRAGAEPTHCQHGVSDQNNCAQCDKLRAERGVK